MDNTQKIKIEEEVLDKAKKQVAEWAERLEVKGVEVENLTISRNGNEENYFSEIEFNLWKDNNLETFFSLVIYMEGRQELELDEVSKFIDDEFLTSLESL